MADKNKCFCYSSTYFCSISCSSHVLNDDEIGGSPGQKEDGLTQQHTTGYWKLRAPANGIRPQVTRQKEGSRVNGLRPQLGP